MDSFGSLNRWGVIMKTCSLLILIVFLCQVPYARAQDGEDANAFLYGFLHGTYTLLGRSPEFGALYSGKVILKKSGAAFNVIRSIDHHKVTGSGRIETATTDETKVLRVRFTDHAVKYEATYLIGSDLDNYARLTGYLYFKDKETKKPGLEALFADH